MRDEDVLVQIIQQNRVLMQVIDGVKSLGLRCVSNDFESE
jgi:hypothetical protein